MQSSDSTSYRIFPKLSKSVPVVHRRNSQRDMHTPKKQTTEYNLDLYDDNDKQYKHTQNSFWCRKYTLCASILVLFVMMALVIAVNVALWMRTEGIVYQLREMDSRRKFNLVFSPVTADTSTNDDQAYGYGYIDMDSHTCSIYWSFLADELDSEIDQLHIHGPLSPISKKEAPVFIALKPTLSYGIYKNRATKHDDATLCHKITQIYYNPTLYYLNAHNPTSPKGAMRSPLQPIFVPP